VQWICLAVDRWCHPTSSSWKRVPSSGAARPHFFREAGGSLQSDGRLILFEPYIGFTEALSRSSLPSRARGVFRDHRSLSDTPPARYYAAQGTRRGCFPEQARRYGPASGVFAMLGHLPPFITSLFWRVQQAMRYIRGVFATHPVSLDVEALPLASLLAVDA